ncbi:Capza1, partial [Symbiodinium microadriaticum]
MSDDENDVDEVTDEERQQIAQHFLLSSPPGQFHEVLSDVRKLLPEGLIADPLAAGIARAFHSKTNKVVTTPAGAKVPLCAAGEIDPTHYVDPKSGQSFALDHLSLKTVEDSSPSNQDVLLESKRAALQAGLDAYVTSRFVAEEAAAGVYAREGRIVAVLSGERPNLRNFWSGRWSSTWTVQCAGDQATIAGEIKVHAHYFEDGNVQLQTTKAIASTTIPFSSEAEFTEQIVAHINASEGDLQSALEDMYANMNEETFRAMRRIMPVKRTKMEWNVNAVRMNKQ